MLGACGVNIHSKWKDHGFHQAFTACREGTEGKNNLVIKLVDCDSGYQSSIPASKCIVIQIF